MQQIGTQCFNMTGERLEIVRRQLNVNKSELARRIGSPQSHISKVLNGRESIGKHLSEQIVRQLRLNYQWWETGQGSIFDDGYQGSEDKAQTSPQVNESNYFYKSAPPTANNEEHLLTRIRDLEEQNRLLKEINELLKQKK